MKMEKDPEYLDKKNRKLFFGDITGSEVLGLMGGIGGIMA